LPTGVVFSGRYARHGAIVAAKLLPKIERVLGLTAGSLSWRISPATIETLLAEAVAGALLKPWQAPTVVAA
jgi:hypothetical protein